MLFMPFYLQQHSYIITSFPLVLNQYVEYVYMFTLIESHSILSRETLIVLMGY